MTIHDISYVTLSYSLLVIQHRLFNIGYLSLTMFCIVAEQKTPLNPLGRFLFTSLLRAICYKKYRWESKTLPRGQNIMSDPLQKI